MNSSEIRQAFLDFFESRGHQVVPSSSLIPGNDPTLLFTNAGMVQFKDIFLGLSHVPYNRAASSQRCVRAGGKHNDLENVGYTARHHTFFEMLGNFSFGDYFKREAIKFAWEFLTVTLRLPAEKLWVTVYEKDDEAASIWLDEMKVDPKRFSRCGDHDNFWSMGDTGPCGPCSEIFYDHGPSIAGGPPGSPDADGDRYIEIWNLVFMQYDRSRDGQLTPLPKPSVDTGMGLERICAVMQHVHSNYEIDIFKHIIGYTADLLKLKECDNKSLRVIADHIRSATFLVIDGVIPSNEGRGYVLRRIIRRAIRHGNKLGFTEAFFYKIVTPLAEVMGQAYPELVKNKAFVEKVLQQEEEQFAKTLEQGLKILEQDLAQLKGKELPGQLIFKLYDTYGFPVDLTRDIALERGLTMDNEGFAAAMQKQQRASQAASQFGNQLDNSISLDAQSDFTGYQHLHHDARVVHLFVKGEEVKELKAGVEAAVVLDRTPFYAESGGQVGDRGVLRNDACKFVVGDTQKRQQAIVHHGELQQGVLRVGDSVHAEVAGENRRAIMLNHSATHLLHAALRQILGEHVQQKGSLVEAARLRFDFTHFEAVNAEQLLQVERLVNEKIRANFPVNTDIKTPEQAKQDGAIALFGEKYGDTVRVLSMGDFSKELCGGTHVERTGDIGYFKIITESGVAAGVRRLEAVSGEMAFDWVVGLDQQISQVSSSLKVARPQVVEKVEQLLERNRQLEKDLEKLKASLTASRSGDLASQAVNVDGIQVLAVRLDDVEPQSLRTSLDELKNKLGSSVVVLVGVNGQQISVTAGISKDCIGRVPSPRELVTSICGKGGGRDDMAQGGGALPANLDALLAKIPDWVRQHLATTQQGSPASL